MSKPRWILVVAVLGLLTHVTRADPPHAPLPAWPEPVVHEGETPLHGVFPSTVHWLAGDGTPVTFQALAVKRGKRKGILLRAITPSGEQDIVTSDLPDAELGVFDHEGGKTVGLQLHAYVPGPDLYQGWVLRWTGSKLEITRKTRFNGYQPQPDWLVDDVRIADRERARRAMQTLRWGAHTADNNAFAHFFDHHDVKVTWRTVAPDGTSTTRDETVDGLELLARLERDGLPLVGHAATCKKLCCTSDTKPLASWRRIENVCFDAEPSGILDFPHVRTIEIAEPGPAAKP